MSPYANILALDPGAHPGVVELSPEGRVLVASHRIADVVGAEMWDLAVCEGQWYHGPQRARPGERGRSVDVNNLLTLAFRAGWQFRGISATRYLRLPPKAWRTALGLGNISKEQAQKKCARELTSDERALFSGIPKGRHGDVLDAIMIGRAALILAPTTTDYDWK